MGPGEAHHLGLVAFEHQQTDLAQALCAEPLGLEVGGQGLQFARIQPRRARVGQDEGERRHEPEPTRPKPSRFQVSARNLGDQGRQRVGVGDSQVAPDGDT